MVDLGVHALDFQFTENQQIYQPLHNARWQLHLIAQFLERIAGWLEHAAYFLKLFLGGNVGFLIQSCSEFGRKLEQLPCIDNILNSLEVVVGVLDDQFVAFWVLQVVLVHLLIQFGPKALALICWEHENLGKLGSELVG